MKNGMVSSTGIGPRFINCAMVGNVAQGNGGGLWVASYGAIGSTPKLTHCLFAGNLAQGAGGGGGMFATDEAGPGHASPVVCNSILWGNVPDQIGDSSGAATFATNRP